VAGSPQRNSGGGSSSPGGGDFKAAVIAATDIVDVIGKTVALKRRGRKFLGLCPFHSEKSPSFNVDSERQFFHCFGCKAGGNVIDFVMKRDGLPFIDALRQLGESAGLEMPRFGVSKEKSGERQQILDANAAAVMFFENLLAGPTDVARSAREYLVSRGISDESIKRFRIGLAMPAWDALLKSPAMKKFSPQLMVTAGLAKNRLNERDEVTGTYDVFRNRLIFPIRDEAGRTIAFGGRKLKDEDNPKYLNSPETPLFSKSRCVFGLDLARQRIVETGMVAVVEGYTDVVMAHQFGVSNVVSILGTAMTEQHVALMRRFANKIVLLFDADAAGDMAVNRAVSLFLTQPIDIAIASMPTDVDPDEYLLEHGAEAFEKVLAGAVDALTFKWKLLSKQFADSDDLTARQRAVDQYLSELASARSSGPVDPMRWGMALQRVSRLTDMPVDQLNRMFPARPKARPRQLFNQTPPAASRHGAGPQAATDGAGEAESSEPALPPTPSGPLTGRDRAERWILGILLAGPEKWHKVQHDVAITDFGDPRHRKLAELYWQHQRDEGEPVFAEFLGELAGPGLTSLAVELVDEIESLADIDALLAESIAHLKEARARLEDRKLLSALRRTSDEKMPEQAEVDLLRQLQEKARKPDLRRG
jgi:DNA primase catalytic core